MAEAIFLHQISVLGFRANVFSRGLHAPVGRKPHPFAAEVAQGRGTPIPEAKRSESLTSADIGLASIVFVMEQSHLRDMHARYPAAVGKTFLLGQWQNNAEIPDPVNEPLSVFEQTWQQCSIGVRDWLDRLHQVGLIRKEANATSA